MANIDEFNELSFYTLAHPDKEYFIHQHAVDAFHAQTASANTKPIKLVFALVGLYLYLEKSYTGREVQLAHIKLARTGHGWTLPDLPESRGRITVSEVLAEPEGMRRDRMIGEWCRVVWMAFAAQQMHIRDISSEL